MSIMTTKPLKYCSGAMLSALRDAGQGKQISAAMCSSLRSRGWTDGKGKITQRGVEYLASRS